VEEPGFWDNPEESQKVMKELKNLKELVDDIKKLYTGYDDIVLLIEMGYEENDESMVREIRSEIQEFEKSFEELRIQTLYDAPCGSRRNRVLRLGGYALPHVQPVGRTKRAVYKGA